MTAKFKSSTELHCWKELACGHCGALFRYMMSKKGSAEAATAPAAEARAREVALKDLENDVEMHPCPHCGIYQQAMVADVQAATHGCLLIVLAVLLAIVGTVGILVTFKAFLLPLSVVTWIAVAFCALGMAAQLWLARRNPNDSLAANRKEAQQEVEKKLLRLERAGDAKQTLADRLPRKLTWGQRAAFLLMLLGIALVASAEIVRLGLAWPANSADPAVLGPGDSADIYVPSELSSLKGMWKGKATVVVLNAQDLGLPSAQLPAITKEDHWGSFIFGKRVKMQDSRLWARVTIPDAPELAGKTMKLRIDLALSYPVKHSVFEFQEEKQSFSDTVEVHLASPRAGLVYTTLWWGGGAFGGILVLCMGFWLYRQAKRTLREAPRAQVVPLTDDDIPEVTPAD